MIVGVSAAWVGLVLSYTELGWWFFPLAALTVTLSSSVQHEVLHGHPTRNPALNEALVYFPLGLFIPYRRFKSLHLRHHNNDRLTDPYDDPESFYLDWGTWERLPVPLKVIMNMNNTLLGRLVIGPGVSLIGFYGAELAHIRDGDRAVMRSWLHHVAGLVPVVLFVSYLGGIPVWAYVLGVAYPAMSLLMLRTFAEHRAHEDAEARSVIVEFCPVFSFLFLNNNLHVVHHALPRAPWYMLPGIYRQARNDWQERNQGYVYSSYLQLGLRHFLKKKEPVAHPNRLPRRTRKGQTA
nr:fatty acid desaturase [Roseibium denhamense]